MRLSVFVTISILGLQFGSTILVSISSTGEQGNGESRFPSVSTDGKVVAFESYASNFSPRENDYTDVFVRDLVSGETKIISKSSSGAFGNARSFSPQISANGRYVAFVSYASNLVSGDTNSYADVFVHDIQTGETSRVSISSFGEQGNNHSGLFGLDISADGRYVVFESYANNLSHDNSNGIFVHDRLTKKTTKVSVSSTGQSAYASFPSISANGRFVSFVSWSSIFVAGDTNGFADVFVHDRLTKVTTRISVSSDGAQGNSWSYFSTISADGRYVVFQSYASNFVVNDTNNVSDVFVHDRRTGETTRISVSSTGEEGNGASGTDGSLGISDDGRFVAFNSLASNLVSSDTNSPSDVFIYDRINHRTLLVSVSSSGEQGNGESGGVSLSGNGTFVAFQSEASNLVPGDKNGYQDVFLRRVK
ncbi:MAG TPA: hypothetical protein VNK96_02525 [Fimbriimonadales bacterium]|nr:hypothetical protein [Fimbriimonadales bacterium]